MTARPAPVTPKSAPPGLDPGAGHLFLREEQIRQAQQLLMFAWQDLSDRSEPVLEHYGLGRAHQRVLLVVGRSPGLTVGDLLTALRITKQSLGRVLGDLQSRGLIDQKPGKQDRRQRLLTLTPLGVEAEQALFDCQREKLVEAYRAAGVAAVEGFRRVLGGLLEPQSQAFLSGDTASRAGRLSERASPKPST